MKLVDIYNSIRPKKLRESSFDDIDFNRVKDKVGIDNPTDYYRVLYSDDRDSADSVDENSPEYKEWYEDRLYELFEEFSSTLYDLIKNGKIRLWRMITLTEEELQNLLNNGGSLGTYWAYDPDYAEDYYGQDKDHSCVFEVDVEESYVDWEATLVIKLEIDQGDDEKEVRLVPKSPIKLRSITVDGNKIDRKIFSGKKYYA